MDRKPAATTGTARPPRVEARQRWRIVFARDRDAPPLTQRELGETTDAALAASGLPLVDAGRSRSRLVFGAALPATMPAERELADLQLAERRPVAAVRRAVVALLPPGYRLLDLHDVWVGEPALAAQVAAAEYRIVIDEAVPAEELRSAVRALLEAPSAVRERPKGDSVVRYDLRPLVVDVAVVDEGPPMVIRACTRIDPERGAGRPEEVVAALGELAGTTLTPRDIVRERLLLDEDLRSPVDARKGAPYTSRSRSGSA